MFYGEAHGDCPAHSEGTGVVVELGLFRRQIAFDDRRRPKLHPILAIHPPSPTDPSLVLALFQNAFANTS